MWDIYVYFCLLAINLALWATRYSRLPATLKLLGISLLATFLLEGYAACLMLDMTSNLYLYHLLTPIQYVLYALVFYSVMDSPTPRRLVLYSMPLYLLAALFITLYIQSTKEYNSYALFLKHLLTCCWALLYYRELFTGLKIARLGREPMFWVSSGLFFHALGNFFNDGLMNYSIAQSYKVAHALFYISVFLGFLLYSTFIVAFLLSWKQDKGGGRPGIPLLVYNREKQH